MAAPNSKEEEEREEAGYLVPLQHTLIETLHTLPQRGPATWLQWHVQLVIPCSTLTFPPWSAESPLKHAAEAQQNLWDRYATPRSHLPARLPLI